MMIWGKQRSTTRTIATLALNIPELYAQRTCAAWGIAIDDAEAQRIVDRVRVQEATAGREPKVSAIARYLHDQYRYYGHFQFLADLEAGSLAT